MDGAIGMLSYFADVLEDCKKIILEDSTFFSNFQLD